MDNQLLSDFLRYHGVDNPELLSALEWKIQRIDAERYQFRDERDKAMEALANAMTMLEGTHHTIDRLMIENAEIEARNVALIIRVKELENALAKEAGK